MDKPNALSKQEKQKHVEQALASGLSQKAYAEQNGLPVSSLSYWIKMHRAKSSPKTSTKATALTPVADRPIQMQPTGNNQQRIDALEAENRDLRAKIASLQNVVMVLGHQIGE